MNGDDPNFGSIMIYQQKMDGSLFKLKIHEYSISTYIYHKDQPNVGKFAIHGSYGKREALLQHKLKKEYTFPHFPWRLSWLTEAGKSN